ncbi:MAG: helix-turn-helix domain-containing protein [Minwuia sp.]|uniref:helix-turn-helix domain-containing protein n=1 Tax=Minwuia sp. TaxID=2493630 RepID=UPI003A8960D6
MNEIALIDQRLSARLKLLRNERAWSLEQLADRSGVSRASLSRLEKGEVSPTAQVLSRLCAAYGLTLTRLMYLVEDDFEPLVRHGDQAVHRDRAAGYTRRSVSPPAGNLNGEIIEGTLEPGTRIDYDGSSHQGLDHHLLLLEGALSMTIDGVSHKLTPGDCLRYRLSGPNTFETPPETGARYLLVML